MTVTATRVTTPSARRVLRRSLFWVAVVAVAVIATLITSAVFRTAATGDDLSASNAAPPGAKAVAEVLRHEGVTVTETSTLKATLKAATDPAATTILVYDPSTRLDAKQLARLDGSADDIVLLAPGFTALRALAPGIAQAGPVSGTLDADCDVPAVAAAGRVTGDGKGYRVTAPGPNITACLSSSKDVYSVVRESTGTHTVTVVGATDAITNEHVGSSGNAALALTLLGAHPDLIWYLPSAADVPGGAPTLAELTPGWVTPLVLLLAATAIAAAVWRGRRLGALVVENLPVTVRASETMEGRARLYAASDARLHALDSLRIGTVERLGRSLGMPRVAGVDEIANAAASVTGIDRRSVHELLVDTVPRNDKELVALSDELLRLERRVEHALRPETPTLRNE